MFWGNFLAMGYKSTLLSTLIPIRYESTIDTLEEMAKSGLPLSVPLHTTLNTLLASDPRPTMREIYKRGYFFSLPGTATYVKGSRLYNM